MPAFRTSAGRVPTPHRRWRLPVLAGLALVGLVMWLAARPRPLLAPGPGNQLGGVLPTVSVSVATFTPLAPTAAPGLASATPLPPTMASTPTHTALPPATQTAIYRAQCALYDHVPADLLTVVNRDTSLGRDFEPADLAEVPLDARNLAFRPIPLRQVAHKPLLDLLDAMNQASLSVWVMSGYRSYGEQQLAYDKWQTDYPDRAAELSAMPGHSEHQLGTAVDFSTPYMDDQFGSFFHTNFYQQPEGAWLLRHAAYYGFTLSYPAWAVESTGYSWEPWHFRYVGIVAQELAAKNITLTQYLDQCPPRQ